MTHTVHLSRKSLFNSGVDEATLASLRRINFSDVIVDIDKVDELDDDE